MLLVLAHLPQLNSPLEQPRKENSNIEQILTSL